MKEITLRDLKRMCDFAINNGFGDRVVLLSDDEELNGVHFPTSGFGAFMKEDMDVCGINLPFGVNKEDIEKYIMLY